MIRILKIEKMQNHRRDKSFSDRSKKIEVKGMSGDLYNANARRASRRFQCLVKRLGTNSTRRRVAPRSGSQFLRERTDDCSVPRRRILKSTINRTTG